jgi:hypothetical protein
MHINYDRLIGERQPFVYLGISENVDGSNNRLVGGMIVRYLLLVHLYVVEL